MCLSVSVPDPPVEVPAPRSTVTAAVALATSYVSFAPETPSTVSAPLPTAIQLALALPVSVSPWSDPLMSSHATTESNPSPVPVAAPRSTTTAVAEPV